MKASSNLQQVLDSGGFAVTAEIGPPKGANPDVVRKRARNMKGYADAFNLTDNQTAVVRLSSWAASYGLSAGGYRTRDADGLPGQEPHRDPVGRLGRERPGREERPMPDRRSSESSATRRRPRTCTT